MSKEKGIEYPKDLTDAIDNLKSKSYKEGYYKALANAIEWLKSNADKYTWYNEMEGESGMNENFISDFEKIVSNSFYGPFDVNAYKKNPHLKVITRSGLAVDDIEVTNHIEMCPVEGVIEREDGSFWPTFFTMDGRHLANRNNSEYDLFFDESLK